MRGGGSRLDMVALGRLDGFTTDDVRIRRDHRQIVSARHLVIWQPETVAAEGGQHHGAAVRDPELRSRLVARLRRPPRDQRYIANLGNAVESAVEGKSQRDCRL